MTTLEKVKREVVLVILQSLTRRMVERYGNEFGDMDLYNQFTDELNSLTQDEEPKQTEEK